MALVTALPTNVNFSSSTIETDCATLLNAVQNMSIELDKVFDQQTLSATTTITNNTIIGTTTGSITLTVDSGKSFVVGMHLKISLISDPSIYMNGSVTSYSGTTLVVYVDYVAKSLVGSSGPWYITQASPGVNAPYVNNITSLTGLTTALSVIQGGTGSTSAAAAKTALSIASSGANSDITSLSNLTTPLNIAQGGTGSVSKETLLPAIGYTRLFTKFQEQYPTGTINYFDQFDPNGVATLNTVLNFNNVICNDAQITLNPESGLMTVPPGTYIVNVISESYRTDTSRVFIQNIDTNTLIVAGTSDFSNDSTGATTDTNNNCSPDITNYILTLSVSTNIFVYHHIGVWHSASCRCPVSLGQLPEVYAQITFERIA